MLVRNIAWFIAVATAILAGCSKDPTQCPPRMPDETKLQAAAHGVDYCDIVRRINAGEDSAIMELLSTSDIFDTAGALGHRAVLLEIVERIGDHRMSEILEGLDRGTLTSVREILIPTDVALDELVSRFPAVVAGLSSDD